MLAWIMFIVGVFAVLFLLFWVFYRLDRRGGDKRTIGLLRYLAVFRGTVWQNNVPRFR